MKISFKNIYYGWYIVASASIISLLTMGMRLGIGPFVKPIMFDLNLSLTEVSAIVAIGMLFYGLGMPLAGSLVKRYNTRFVLLIGLLVVCLSILWTIFSNGFVSFLLSFGIFLSLGLAFLSNITMSPIISRWFVRQRGKALVYLTTGGMAGMAVMTPVETVLIQLVGWQWTLIIFAGVFVCVVIPSAIFVFREDVPEGADIAATLEGEIRHKPDPPEITWRDAVKTRAYWHIVIGMFACGFAMNLMGSHAVPMLVDHNFAPVQASFGVGMIGVVAIFGTIFLASIADRYPRKNILFFIYFIRGLGLLGLVYVVTPGQLFFVTATAGLVWAGSIAMSSAILTDLYGVRLLGLLNGWAFFGHQIGGALGSFLGGWGYEVCGTHLLAFGTAAFFSIFASIVSFFIPQKITFSKFMKLGQERPIVK